MRAGAVAGAGWASQCTLPWGCFVRIVGAGVSQGPMAQWGSPIRLAKVPGLCSCLCYQGGEMYGTSVDRVLELYTYWVGTLGLAN